MYEQRFDRYSYHPMMDFGAEALTTGRKTAPLRLKPVARFLGLSGLGGGLGYMAVGGPVGILGGILLGMVADEVLERVR